MDTQSTQHPERAVDVELHEPGLDNPRYVARATQFGLSAESDTLEGAIVLLLRDLRALLAAKERGEQQ